jgi:hypothetical protein
VTNNDRWLSGSFALGGFAERSYLEIFRIYKALRQGGRTMRTEDDTQFGGWRIAFIAATLMVSGCGGRLSD